MPLTRDQKMLAVAAVEYRLAHSSLYECLSVLEDIRCRDRAMKFRLEMWKDGSFASQAIDHAKKVLNCNRYPNVK